MLRFDTEFRFSDLAEITHQKPKARRHKTPDMRVVIIRRLGNEIETIKGKLHTEREAGRSRVGIKPDDGSVFVGHVGALIEDAARCRTSAPIQIRLQNLTDG